MTFINPDQYDIKLSEFYPEDVLCGPLSSEEDPGKTANTESGLTIELESSCDPTFDFDCKKICRETIVESGSFTISNSCTIPITVTGFKMTDPERFSLFKFPDYTGVKVYHSGIVEQLPFTLEADQKKQIHTFFHPLYDESMDGKEGTILNRTGDQFGSYVKIKPGFPILNCEDGDACKPTIILTGEFLEKDRKEITWGDNKDNFDQDFKKESLEGLRLEEINNEFFLRKKTSSFFTMDSSKEMREQYIDFLQATVDYAIELEDNSWYNTYGDYGITGSLGLFNDLIESILDTTVSASLEQANESGGNIKIIANQYLGSAGDNINFELKYGEPSNDVSASATNVIVSRSEATGSEVDTSVVVDQINDYVATNNSDFVLSGELEGSDGKILAFSKKLSGGNDGTTDTFNAITTSDFEKEYQQLDAFYNKAIKFRSQYNQPNITLTYNDKNYDGIIGYNTPIENVPLMSNQAVFYRLDEGDSEIFICDVGDFENDIIRE
jgi:hypothetical protein